MRYMTLIQTMQIDKYQTVWRLAIFKNRISVKTRLISCNEFSQLFENPLFLVLRQFLMEIFVNLSHNYYQTMMINFVLILQFQVVNSNHV